MGCRLSKPKRESVDDAASLPPSLRAPLPSSLRAPPPIRARAPPPLTNVRDTDYDQIICPIDAEWKFFKSDLLKNGKVGKCYYAYNIPGLQYYVKIFSNGIAEKNDGKAWIAFVVNDSDERKITSEFTSSVESANFSRQSSRIYVPGDILAYPFVESHQFLASKSKYFVDGILTVKVKGILKAPRPMISKITSPISYQWKINEKDLKVKKHSKGTLRSKKIDVPTFSGTKYYLEICPSKVKDSEESAVYLYLKTESETENQIKVSYDFSVGSAHVSRGKENICEGPNCCGIYLCTTNMVFDPTKRFIVDGYLTINVNGILMIEKNHFIILNCKNDLAPESQKMNEKDLLVAAGGKHFHVHKQVLLDVSPVLAEMPDTKNRITVRGFCSKIVDAAIKLCYSADESFEFTLEEMLSLYRFGNKYRIQFIMDIVEDYLIQDISPSNVVSLIKFSAPDSFNVVKLHQNCLDFLTKSLKKSTPIYALECLDKDVIVKMLSNHPNLMPVFNQWSYFCVNV